MEYATDEEPHSTLHITFGELLQLVWVRAKDNTEIKAIMNQEMHDALCMCFTGCLSRLINCLNGFYDDVEITIASNEQISNVITMVKRRLVEAGTFTIDAWRNQVIQELQERNYEQATIDEWVAFIE